jgi:hypothetical protein
MRLFSVTPRTRFLVALACALSALVWQLGREPRHQVSAAPLAAPAPAQANAEALAVLRKIVAPDGQAFDFFGAVALSGDTLAVGAKGSTFSTSFGDRASQGAVYIFKRGLGDNWTFVKKLLAPDGAAGDQFGCAVALEDDTLVVGAAGADPDGVTNRGAAYVFYRNRGGTENWGLVTRLLAADGLTDDGFGFAVDISGDTIVVGAPFDDTLDAGGQSGSCPDRGSVYIFERNLGGADNWGLSKQLDLLYSRARMFFGFSVGISGNTIVVGTPGDEVAGFTARGSAYVFERNLGGAGNWGVIPQLLAPGGLAFDLFGWSVGIDGDLIVVGAPLAELYGEDQGSAYLYARNQGGAGNWGFARRFFSTDGAAGDFFGFSVAVEGQQVVVGAPGDDQDGRANQGSASVFARGPGMTGVWRLRKQLFASDGLTGDAFGASVAISDGLIAVGAPNDDVGENEEQGSAYIFASFPFALTPERLPSGLAGREYSQTITPADGSTPFSVVITRGSLPPGLSLDSATGLISGTPRASGEFLFTVTATNATGAQNMTTYGLYVDCPYITLDPNKLPDGRTGLPYKQKLIVVSEPLANTPFTFTADARLPIGLRLDANTGLISGTPRITGNYTFTVIVTDAYGCMGMREYTIRISF